MSEVKMASASDSVRERLKSVYRRLPAPVRRRVATGRAKARATADAQLRRMHAKGPLLSVVMPVYNVEGYLDEAVRSVLDQSLSDFELILVDDGSTDTSGAMCDDFAAADSRVRVIHKQNAGLGAARNTGIAAARGTYLVFIDSDDYVTPGAYEAMVETLRRTGSDLVTGNVRRKRGIRTQQAWNQSRSHRYDKFGVTLRETPDLVFDTVAWNKVFRRAFWNKHVRAFPEGKLYEDMLPIFTAFAAAKSIDVLSRVVYVWRLRDEGNSITQRLLEPENIDDRFEMVDAIDSMIVDLQMPESLRDLLRDKVLEGDLWIYVREMRGAPDEVISRIRRGVARYWSLASPERRLSAHPEHRICYWLLEQDRAVDVEPFRQWYSTVHDAFPINDVDGRLLLDPTDCPVSLAGMPSEYLDLDPVALTISSVMGVRWTQPFVLTVDGYAYTRFVSDGDQVIQLVATNTVSKAEVTFDVERTDSPESAIWAWDTVSTHQHDGYRCDIDVARLLDAAGFANGRSEWVVKIRVLDGDVDRLRDLSRIWRSGSAAITPSTVLPDGTVVTARTTDGRPLAVTLDRTGIFAASAQMADPSTAVVRFEADGKPAEVVAIEARVHREIVGDRRDDGSFAFELPAPIEPATSSWWTFRARVGGTRKAVLAPAGFAMSSEATRTGMRTTVGRTGMLAVRCDLAAVFIDQITVDDNGDIQIGGHLSALDAVEVSLNAQPEMWVAATVTGSRFTARIPTTYQLGDREVPFPEGSYAITARRGGEASAAVDVNATDDVVTGFPTSHLRTLSKVRFSRTGAGGIAVDVSAPVPDDQLGRPAQSRLIGRYTAGEARELEDAVFFCTDLGSNVGDSALAIQQELARRGAALRMYWGVTDRSVVVPDGVEPVVKLSKEWYDKLNTARYLVNNYGGLWGLRKGSGQRYLQTWHGTPFKYIGASEQRHKNAPAALLAKMRIEAAEWDAAVSPSPYMTSLISSDLQFDGPVLETGYPRNDRLASATPDEIAALRDRLGLRRASKVLLYAPTFRENQRQGWRADLYDALDLDRLVKLLGPDWTVLLRGHSFNARNDHIDRSHGQLVDVTRHTNINDLYLVADAMVTDYSSVMFDFAVTGKPMAFFTPDLRQYQASRGVYFDLAETVPGPVLADVAHLGEALADLTKLRTEYAKRYAEFRERFTPWDDGKAAARVVDAFFS